MVRDNAPYVLLVHFNGFATESYAGSVPAGPVHESVSLLGPIDLPGLRKHIASLGLFQSKNEWALSDVIKHCTELTVIYLCHDDTVGTVEHLRIDRNYVEGTKPKTN